MTYYAVEQLILLSRELGREDRRLAILGEGCTSCRVNETSFLVKVSGTSLATLGADDITECRFEPLLKLLDRRDDCSDREITETLSASRVSQQAQRPSLEAVFHAYLLSLPEYHWVGHTHPLAVTGILCSPRAQDFATRRLFPDEIVYCGSRSILVPYVHPGLALARKVKAAVESFRAETGTVPRIILMTNHGLVAPAATPAGVLSATRMAVKAGEIFSIAVSQGGVVFLDPREVERIEASGDEADRRKQLGI